MKVTIVKERIIEGLQKAAGIIPTKTGAAYLRSVWLKTGENSISVIATDANIEFTGTYPAEIAEEGIVGVHGRSFVDLMRQLPEGEITLSTESAQKARGTGAVPEQSSLSGDTEQKFLLLQQGRRKYKLPLNDPSWFQSISEFPAENSVIWSGDFLEELLDKITYCIADDEASDAISCMFLNPKENGRIEACGLDGHQFAMMAFVNDELAGLLPPEGLLIQKKYLADIKKWLNGNEIYVNVTNNRLHLRTADATETLSIPLASYQYPDYAPFMNQLNGDVSSLEVGKRECIDALSRISIFNTVNDYCTYMDLSENETMLSAQGQDTGFARESIEAEYRGTLSRIAFPTRKLMEIMGHFNSEKITMNFSGAESPCGIRGENDPDYLVIIMPMKVVESSYYSEVD